jgi:predicted DNA-binding protein
MRKKKNKKEYAAIYTRIPREIYLRLLEESERTGATMTFLIRKCIEFKYVG